MERLRRLKINNRRAIKTNRVDDNVSQKLLVVLFQDQGFLLIGTLFFRDRLANRAGILTAKSHLYRLLYGHHSRVLVNHIGPSNTLQNNPLASAGKNKRHENNHMGQASHTNGMSQ